MLSLKGLNTLEAYHTLSIDGNVDPARMRQARQVLWNTLNGHKLYTLVAKDGHFAHLGTTREYQHMLLNDSVFRAPYRLCAAAHVWVDATVRIAQPEQSHLYSAALLNAILHGGHGRVANGAVIEHCELSGHFCIEEEAVVSGLHGWLGRGVRVAPLTVVQQTPIDRHRLVQHPRLATMLARAPALADSQLTVLSVFGVNDAIKCVADHAKATYCHRSWVHLRSVHMVFFFFLFISCRFTVFVWRLTGFKQASLFEQTQSNAQDIWGDLPSKHQTLWTARLFPLFQTSPSVDGVESNSVRISQGGGILLPVWGVTQH
jgi:hypothetical protein